MNKKPQPKYRFTDLRRKVGNTDNALPACRLIFPARPGWRQEGDGYRWVQLFICLMVRSKMCVFGGPVVLMRLA